MDSESVVLVQEAAGLLQAGEVDRRATGVGVEFLGRVPVRIAVMRPAPSRDSYGLWIGLRLEIHSLVIKVFSRRIQR